MKLELRHLAPYLPYDVKYACNMSYMPSRIEDWEEKGTLTYWEDLNGNNTINFLLEGETLTNVPIKLILRPLSDLTKNTKIEDETITYEELISTDKNAFGINGNNDPVMWNRNSNKWEVSSINDLPYETVSGLFKYHFDVYGLIEAGLAIDINTLDKKD